MARDEQRISEVKEAAAEIGGKAFTVAKAGYRSGLNLNEDLVETDEWTKEKIEERTAKLVDRAMEVFRL